VREVKERDFFLSHKNERKRERGKRDRERGGLFGRIF